ncbi:polysaccharide biosynthesis/export family protein [Fluviicola chungangensis]|nr:polysaccharide biosynthesis/export family protein [Fluviicola chungangensis]
MPKISIPFLVSAFILALLSVSCRTAKEIVYFQDLETDSLQVSAQNFTPIFKVDDFLSIVITAEDQESARIYNLPTASSSNQGYTIGNPALYGYLVNARGEISLPILGILNVAGKNRMDVESEIKTMLTGHLKNPTVHIQILNFKVTVLGDVKSPGTFKIPNERITLLEAIGLAGDLKMSGKRENIKVIRDSSGVKMEYSINLTKKDVFRSPAYYLQQNDVVYVQPNAAARSEGAFWRTSGAIFISISSLVITTISIITK